MSKNNCFVNTNPCSGCGACYAVCPVSAIKTEINKNGFYEATVNEDKCISCGKCVKVCTKYIGQENQIDRDNFPVYSFVYGNKETLKNSTSGAASWALIETAISQGYKIAGVEYDYSSDTAKTFIAQDLKQAQKSKGSKYLQADTRIYKDILKENGKFLVFGTPCQIAGFAKAVQVNNRREDFLLVDCFCHGVPSYLVWNNLLKYIGIEHPQDVAFRSKKGGWHSFYMEISGKDKVYKADARTNPFYKFFFSDLLLNDSCYTCKTKSACFADIRLGDFWGADCDLTEEGVSLVLPLSDLGKEYLKLLQCKGQLKDISNLRGKIIKSQSAFKDTPQKKERREKLFSVLKQQGLSAALSCYYNGQSFKTKAAAKLKALLPLFVAKYVRFITHKIKDTKHTVFKISAYTP